MKNTYAIFAAIVIVIILIGGCVGEEFNLGKDEEKRFSSEMELNFFLYSKQDSGYYGGDVLEAFNTAIGSSSATRQTSGAVKSESVSADDFSTTNIQVTGVDEPDIVKNDGKYIYVVANNKLTIVDAYPAENAEILSTLEFSGSPTEIFINDDKLVVFGRNDNYGSVYENTYRDIGYGGSSGTFINVYDITDRKNPELSRNITLEGSYYDSRMIGDYVYVIADQYVYYRDDEPVPLPIITSDSVAKEVPASDIYYFDVPDSSYRYTIFLSLNVKNDNEAYKERVYLMGYTQDMYVSQNNIYITYMSQLTQGYRRQRMIDDVIKPLLPFDRSSQIDTIMDSNISDYDKWNKIEDIVNEYKESLSDANKKDFEEKLEELGTKLEEELQKMSEMSVIHKISIDNGNIKYSTNGKVPGRVLNQFSMDEHNGFFRIATTVGRLARTAGQATSSNNVYILDGNLNTVGKLEDLAPGESIYSARFMGNRVYLVTFRKVDPLFVIDASNPYNPTVLGKLKIPGYSDYLHPYDENHLIGLGKEAIGAEEGDFSWYQGVKISLFDVTDVSKPKEIAKYEIGDRGTDSYALTDHKAFLFSKDKNLLVIPVLLAEIDEEKYPAGVEPNTYGDYVWQGAYVFDLSLNGIELRGRVGHVEDESVFDKSGYYYYSENSVKRSLYMDQTLYTISDSIIKMNNLNDLSEINKVEIS